MKNNSSSGGIGFFGLLTIVFIVLKLLKVINWSWFWVLSPTIILTVVCIVLGIVFILIGSRNE
jgi:hypothetical protein